MNNIGTLAVDGCYIWVQPQPAQAPPHCTNLSPINGLRTSHRTVV